jgi:hypothetical protein
VDLDYIFGDLAANHSSSLDANMELLDQLEFSDVEKDKFIQLEFQTLPVSISCPKYVHCAILTMRFSHFASPLVDATTCLSHLEKIY